MELHILKPRKALNKAFLKVKPNNKKHIILKNVADGGKEEFFIRRSASTKALTTTEMLEYISSHWG